VVVRHTAVNLGGRGAALVQAECRFIPEAHDDELVWRPPVIRALVLVPLGWLKPNRSNMDMAPQ
jgi:hypothetical protein